VAARNSQQSRQLLRRELLKFAPFERSALKR